MSKTEEPPKPSPESASLLHRLAGPSVTKAGLAKDQSEINRIIAEASKGSKFYENEKRKDKELTEKIEKILSLKNDLMREADIEGIESDVDRLIEELESQRDLTQYIVHVDMDAFYASVELLHNPNLAGKPFGVGKGVLCTASYEARKYGVRSGMAGFVAKKLCPELTLLSLNFQLYGEMSKKVMDIFRQYDPSMLVAGCDEGYLNITPYCKEHNLSPEDCVQEMRARVHRETKLTASAGIAPNKMLAKICSDKNKPNGQFCMSFDRESVMAFMKDLSIRKVPGVGKVHERLLDSIGVKICGDIYTHRAIISVMDKHFGLHYLMRAYLGIASNDVEPHKREERKSIGAERTFSPIGDQNKIMEKLEEVAEELEDDMKRNGWAGKTVTLKYKLDTYQVFTRAKSFDRWITAKQELFHTGKELIKAEFPLRLRLIGLRITKLKDLRAPVDKGIQRFFDPSGHSPRKKRKLPAEEEAPMHEIMNEDDAMPGFLEDDQWGDDQEGGDDVDVDDDIQEINLDFQGEGSKDNLTLALAGKPTSSRPALSKPKSRVGAESPPSKSGKSSSKPTQICPICSKELETDNAGLNEHIDFCLSKDVIMAATTISKEKTAPEVKKRKK